MISGDRWAIVKLSWQLLFHRQVFMVIIARLKFMKEYGFIPNMLDKSRFNRCLHKVGKLLYELFEIVSSYFRDLCCEMHYIIDSFPVAVCHNMRLANCKIVRIRNGGVTLRVCKVIFMVLKYNYWQQKMESQLLSILHPEKPVCKSIRKNDWQITRGSIIV